MVSGVREDESCLEDKMKKIIQEMNPLDDCQMYDRRKGRCVGLNNTYCRFEECNFYKPRKNDDKEKGGGFFFDE